PDITVSTKEAYSLISPMPPEIPLGEIIQKPVSEWKGLLKNDFEPPIFKKYPEICRIKEQLYAKGAVYASMSGSGSSVYGFFEKETDIRFDNCWVWKNKEL
ncbi:MAG: 4-(cytidine 5'-diphospho)-2-C-methyl-D-erythritol kinase, partial [Petrimonas sp.]|nr:4-(cytidine 5'-diphospho)-2-C-methyl-D-erythritol kinase [Petrimonas sp.]